VAEALHAFDFGKSNGLLATIADCWKVAPEEVIRLANASEPRFPELAGPVIDAAEKGDASARVIAERAGKALAAWLARSSNGCGLPEALSRGASGWCAAGSPLVRQSFKDAMR